MRLSSMIPSLSSWRTARSIPAQALAILLVGSSLASAANVICEWLITYKTLGGTTTDLFFVAVFLLVQSSTCRLTLTLRIACTSPVKPAYCHDTMQTRKKSHTAAKAEQSTQIDSTLDTIRECSNLLRFS
jgi:hypothetical protein